MIDKTKIIDALMDRLKNLPAGHYIDLRTYKRNRSVMIVKKSETELLVVENGYQREEFEIKIEKLKKLMKTLLKREFPRSKKVRLYLMGEYHEKEALTVNRKII